MALDHGNEKFGFGGSEAEAFGGGHVLVVRLLVSGCCVMRVCVLWCCSRISAL